MGGLFHGDSITISSDYWKYKVVVSYTLSSNIDRGFHEPERFEVRSKELIMMQYFNEKPLF